MVGWATRSFNDVIVPSGTIDPRKAPDVPFQYIDVSSISNQTFEIVETTEILGKDAPSRARRLVRAGDVLFATIRPTLQRIAVVPQELDGQVCSTGYFVFRTKPEIDGRFLYYYLFSDAFMGAMETLQSGASYPAVNDSQVRQQQISFPPLPEQKRIVAILDEAFAGIDAAVANTEKNLANSRELFESYLKGVFTRKGEGWVVKKFGNLVQSTTIGLVKNKREQGPTLQYKYIKMNNIKNDNRFDGSSTVHVDATIEELEKFRLQDGDFLFNTRNSHELVGKSCLYRASSNEPVLYNNNIMRVRFCDEIYAPFAAHAFNSNLVTEQLESIKSGTTNVSAIYYNLLKNIVIVYPSIEKQRQISSNIDSLQEQIQTLKINYQQKLAALAELKQSILQKAFAGELTALPDQALEEAVA